MGFGGHNVRKKYCLKCQDHTLEYLVERICATLYDICDPFWENPYKRGHQLFLFFFTYRIYGARGPRLPSLTEITQVFFELWIKTFMHNRSIIISRFRENAF